MLRLLMWAQYLFFVGFHLFNLNISPKKISFATFAADNKHINDPICKKTMRNEKSKAAFEEAVKYIPGGVNSPVRALKAVGGTPLFIHHAEGNRLHDLDGNILTDYCLSWGVFIAGHNNPIVNEAVTDAISRGTSYGIPTLSETALARKVGEMMPTMERVRFVNSGTEATMSAIRLARGYTGRRKIVKFEGCYHGHADHLLVSAGSAVARLGGASSAGVPEAFVSLTLVVPYNDIDALEEVFKKEGEDIAAVIIEPVAANMGVVIPDDGFLAALRRITENYGSLLIFDEVITGFRLSPGGAGQLFNIRPDLSCVGKIVGGGFPAAAFGGRADIMALLAPDGPVYQAGTLSGNPVAMSAGMATLGILSEPDFYPTLNNRIDSFESELRSITASHGISINRVGPMFTMFFRDEAPRNFKDVNTSDLDRFARYFRHMLSHGIYVSPSQFESNFISIRHTEDDFSQFLDAVKDFVAQ